MRMSFVVRSAIGVIESVLLVAVAAQVVCAADVIYFLVGTLPESEVIPISAPQDIQQARDLIANGQGAISLVSATVDCGKDGINRNYLDLWMAN